MARRRDGSERGESGDGRWGYRSRCYSLKRSMMLRIRSACSLSEFDADAACPAPVEDSRVTRLISTTDRLILSLAADCSSAAAAIDCTIVTGPRTLDDVAVPHQPNSQLDALADTSVPASMRSTATVVCSDLADAHRDFFVAWVVLGEPRTSSATTANPAVLARTPPRSPRSAPAGGLVCDVVDDADDLADLFALFPERSDRHRRALPDRMSFISCTVRSTTPPVDASAPA